MTGIVEWPVLLMVVGAIVTTFILAAGVITKAFRWVYDDANNQRENFSKLREDLSKTYATIEAQKLIKEALEERGARLEKVVEGLSGAIDRLAQKQDAAMHELIQALAAKT